MRRELLPDRPLRLSRRYRNNRLAVILIFASFAGLFLIAFTVLAIRDLRGLSREATVWAKGAPCEGSYQLQFGEETEVAIECTTAQGRNVSGTLTLYNMSYDYLEHGDDIRYYDGDFAISSGIARIEQRRSAAYGGMIAGSILVVILSAFALWFWRRFVRVRRVVETGDEITVDVVRVKPKMRGKHMTHMRHVFWKHPVTGKIKKTNLDEKAGLAWINSHEHKALALRSGNHVVLLAGNLMPVDLDGEPDRAEILARLEKDGGGQPRGLPELADWIVYSPPVARS